MSQALNFDKFCGGTVENHPFNELKVGDSASITKTVTIDDLRLFAAATGDANPSMLDPEFADSSIYREVVAHGMWSGAMLVNLLGSELPGLGTILVDQNLRYLRPVTVGDAVTFKITVERKYERTQHVLFDAEVTLANGLRAVTGTLEVLAPTEKIVRQQLCVPEATLSNRDERFQRFIALAEGMDPVATAVVHPCDEESLKGAILAAARGLICPILVGPSDRIHQIAHAIGVDISRFQLIDSPYSQESARIAVELVRKGKAEALMKGSLHTDELMQAILTQTPLRTKRRMSHLFRFDVPMYDKPLFITDAALNIHPQLLEKADIVQNAIDAVRIFGLDSPKVAILSAVETINPALTSTLDAAALCKMAERGQIHGGQLDGPLAFDNAISPEAARIKGLRSVVAGQADILVVPDLESGNMLAKQLRYMAGASGAGLVLGARVPIALTSRADGPRARIASALLMKLLAHHYRQHRP